MSNDKCAFFEPEPTAVARARRLARETLREWKVKDSLVDDAVLLVSELVTNAVRHAGTRARLSLRRQNGSVEAAVTDWHPARRLPDPPFPDDFTERGRGLFLPTALGQTWGVTYTATTKTVWFRLQAGSGPAAAPAWPAVPPAVPEPRPLPRELGRMEFAELVRHTLEAVRDVVSAEAAYALMADEEGELRVRGATGIALPAALTSASPSVVLSGGVTAQSSLVVPFFVDGRVIGLLGAAASEPDRFTHEDTERAQEVADRVAIALERLRLSELERVRRGRVAFLAEASEMLSSTLDQTRAAALAAQLIVPRLAAWCAVYLADSADEPGLAYVWHADESKTDALEELLVAIPPPSPTGNHSWSLATGSKVRLSPEAARLARDSAWCFPLTARGRWLGVVVIGRTRDDPRWPDPPSQQAFELAEDLTRRVALALDNARLYESQRRTSQALQRSLLPPALPEIPRVDLAAAHEAAGETNEVGGDFYDVFQIAEDRWRFAIGDVCGTGPEAAAVTGLARHSLRILAGEGQGIADVLERLNDLILREGPRGRFLTLLHGEITSTPSGPLRVSLVCAGHPLPLLLRAQSPFEPPRPAVEPQMLLGVMERVSFGIEDFELFPGDILLCVTDGITERRDDRGALLDDDCGLARLLAACGGLTASDVVARVRRAVEDFGSAPPGDDMAILAISARA